MSDRRWGRSFTGIVVIQAWWRRYYSQASSGNRVSPKLRPFVGVHVYGVEHRRKVSQLQEVEHVELKTSSIALCAEQGKEQTEQDTFQKQYVEKVAPEDDFVDFHPVNEPIEPQYRHQRHAEIQHIKVRQLLQSGYIEGGGHRH